MGNKFLEMCLAAVRTIPVIFITAVIVWSYYAYVIQMCFFTIESTVEKVFYLLFFHLILIIFLWSYWKTIFTPIALPPDEYYIKNMEEMTRDLLTSSESRKKTLNAFGKGLGVQCRLINGDVRFCEKCNCIKPDRAHHCSVCGKCILKLDHHCPWVNNCVCFSNYKFFMLFLLYTMLYCIFIFATSFQYFIHFWTGISNVKVNLGSLHVVFLFFVSIMFFISSIALFSFHCYLIALNKSTIESFQVPIFSNGVKDSNAFNIGVKSNFYEVFGSNALYWFLPIFTGYGDGLKYPTRTSTIPSNNYNTMESNLNAPNYCNSTIINMHDDNFNNNNVNNNNNNNVTMTTTASSTTLLDDHHILLNTNDDVENV